MPYEVRLDLYHTSFLHIYLYWILHGVFELNVDIHSDTLMSYKCPLGGFDIIENYEVLIHDVMRDEFCKYYSKGETKY